MKCFTCDNEIRAIDGEPWIKYQPKNGTWKALCEQCCLDLADQIYGNSGSVAGGLIKLVYKDCLSRSAGRKKRHQIKNYKKILGLLLQKYHFACVKCGASENLTIDHILPVSKKGSDHISNLQILCRSCNSKKGAKLEV